MTTFSVAFKKISVVPEFSGDLRIGDADVASAVRDGIVRVQAANISLFPSSPKQKMRVCVLTEFQAAQYELRGILPNCTNVNPNAECSGAHLHLSFKEAERLVGDNTGVSSEARWVGGHFMIARNVKVGYVNAGGVMALVDYLPRGRGRRQWFGKASRR